MKTLLRLLAAIPVMVAAPVIGILSLAALLLSDLLGRFKRRMPLPADTRPNATCATVVIPNWNGRDLLEKYIPPLIEALAGHPDNELLVVDNGSEDGSAAFLAECFPSVKVLALPRNLGFGGGSNSGFAAAKNDIVVLLNSDMRVDQNFLQPLLDGFSDEKVFAVSCQIFFSDSEKHREETGLTEGWWENGRLWVGHRIDEKVNRPFPCFYGGGGSCAFDRRKFMELGGFDELLRPFYYEDTDIGYMAWKRGWKCLYQPASIVFHEHRGTIGKKFDRSYVDGVVRKNALLWVWKNIHSGPRLAGHFAFAIANTIVSALSGNRERGPFLRDLWNAAKQIGGAMRSRSRARQLSVIRDADAFRRTRGSHFRDTFFPLPVRPEPLNVLFLSPYPICPPIHGGGVFMNQTIHELVKYCRLHLVALLDEEWQLHTHEEMDKLCASTEYILRMTGRLRQLASIEPYAVREFANRDLDWVIDRKIFIDEIDVFQIEYTNMGQYARGFKRIPSILFEHDVYFQSVGRKIEKIRNPLKLLSPGFEYLRALKYELRMLPKVDRIQMCSEANKKYLASFLPELEPIMQAGLRAGIDTSRYEFKPSGRTPDTLLFLGSFRHIPNVEALEWFVTQVFSKVLAKRPSVRLILIGSDAPPRHSLPDIPNIELVGFVDDVRVPLGDFAVFICPILTGSGVRVKLLEAFAAGIPVVSTTIGAEGLTERHGDICALADSPEEFAERTLELLGEPSTAARMAERARSEVVDKWDMTVITKRLVGTYYDAVADMRKR